MPNYTQGQQALIADAFSGTTYVPNQMSVQHTPVYDTVTLTAAGPTNILSVLTSAFFTNVGSASGKTYAQSNMTQSQKLKGPEAFSIFGFRFRYSENISVLDLWNLINGFAYEFWMADKALQRAPIWYFNAGGGVSGFTTQTYANAGAGTIFNNGVPARNEMHKLALPIVIENQGSFYAQLQGTQYTLNAAGSGMTLVSLLDGLYAFGVS